MIAVVTFQGFTESDQYPSGTEDLFFDVIREFSTKRVTTYHPRRWNSDIRALLDQLVRHRIHDVILVGYSWGAGYACMKFAQLAPERGIKIKLALLCDPVYRPLWLPAWMGANPLCVGAVTKSAKIEVPRSVARVAWVRQKISIPSGHDLVSKYGTTRIEPGRFLEYSHTSIDSASQWFSLVRNELEFELRPQA